MERASDRDGGECSAYVKSYDDVREVPVAATNELCLRREAHPQPSGDGVVTR
jgi:hypothetical protein